MADHGGDAESGAKFMAGILGGLAVVVTGHPLDTIKSRVQAGMFNKASVMQVAMRTVREEGIMALYKGVRSPLLGTPPIYAISFATWGWGQARALELGFVSYSAERGRDELSHAGLFLAGAFSGLCQSVVYGPVDLLKKRLMLQRSGGGGGSGAAYPYKGLLDAGRTIVAEEGVRGLFVGYPVVLAFFVPACGMWYGAYDVFRRLLNPDPDHPSTLPTLAAGAAAGASAWGSMFPVELVATRIQTERVAQSQTRTPVAKVISAVYAEGGIRAFYRGLTPCLARAVVADAACFGAYELAMRAYHAFFASA